MRRSACCPFFRRPLCHKQASTCGRALESSKYVEMSRLLRGMIEGRCHRTFTVASHRPALVRKTIQTVVTENEVVEQPDTQQVSSVSQPCGEGSILRARCEVFGRMIKQRTMLALVPPDRRVHERRHCSTIHTIDMPIDKRHLSLYCARRDSQFSAQGTETAA